MQGKRADSIIHGGGSAFYSVGCPSKFSWLTLAALVAYLAAFSPGVGPVPWAINAEIYPVEVRGVATGIAAAANWGANAAIAQIFLTALQRMGGGWTFWALAGCAVVGWVWSWAVVPETKGLTLDEIQRMFMVVHGEPELRDQNLDAGVSLQYPGEVGLTRVVGRR